MIQANARLISAAMDHVSLAATDVAQIDKGLWGALTKSLLPALSLAAVRQLHAEGHAKAIGIAIRKATLAQVRKIMKSWNPRRRIGADDALNTLHNEAIALASGRADPVPPPEPRARRSKK
jgi:hypothetical protein